MMASKSRVSTHELEKLISVVKDHPSIYDVSRPDYKDSSVHENVWSSIAYTMGREDISDKEWKKKWKNQRDMYVKKKRELKTSRNGQAAFSKRKSPLMSIMSFLDKFIEPSSTDSNLQEPSAVSDSDGSFNLADEDTVGVPERSSTVSLPQPSQEHEDRSVSPMLSAFSTSQVSTASQRTTRPFTRRKDKNRKKGLKGQELGKLTALAELIQMHEIQRTDLQTQINQERATPKSVAKSFFETCTLRMEKLSEETQSLLQLQISQLFFNAENPSVPPIPVTTLPRRQVSVLAADTPNQAMYTEHISDVILDATKMEQAVSDD